MPAQQKKRCRTDAQTIDEERVPWVDPVPIRGWLCRQQGDSSIHDLAKLCKVTDEAISRLLRGLTTRTSLDVVDKILVGFESPMELGRLYPHLYDDASVFA